MSAAATETDDSSEWAEEIRHETGMQISFSFISTSYYGRRDAIITSPQVTCRSHDTSFLATSSSSLLSLSAFAAFVLRALSSVNPTTSLFVCAWHVVIRDS
jgi:hypothetical protein